MNIFERFCDEKQIKAYRESFYHHCMSKGWSEFTVETLEEEWKEFLSHLLLTL